MPDPADPESPISVLRRTWSGHGKVEWIGLRPARQAPMRIVDAVQASVEEGLSGDRFSGKPGAPRQVSLIQHEHLDGIAKLMGVCEVSPELVRRNIVISGINLTSLKGARFGLGDAVMEGTGACPPCSRMEQALGPGGYNAMRGHGGIVARVVVSGIIRCGDAVKFLNLLE